MALVMDGVKRVGPARPAVDAGRVTAGGARPNRLAARRTRPEVVDLDGVRRMVAAPPAEVRSEPAPRPQPRFGRLFGGSARRPAMALGALSALVAAGVTAHLLAGPKTVAAQAEAAPTASATVRPSATPSPTPALAAEQTNLQQLLNVFVAAHTGAPFNIVVKDLGTGATAGINPDRSYESASLYKLFVADQIYHLIDTGGLNYSSSAGGGSGNTVKGCLSLMITISDNTCGRALGAILNWGTQNPALAAQGFTETDLTTPQATSARDVADLFEKLYDNTLDSPASNAAFLSLLKNQKVNDRLPQGLPAGTVIAHKTGNLDAVVHDGGIVYGPKTNYVVVVMSGPWAVPGDAPAQFATLSQQLWQFFEQ